jgi:hypothetical protein
LSVFTNVFAFTEARVAPQDVNIEQTEPVGTYAARLKFDDGHETGVSSGFGLAADARLTTADIFNPTPPALFVEAQETS